MKTAIVYYSEHHGNTKKVLDAIAERGGAALIDVSGDPNADLSAFDLIGFASGIYYSQFHDTVLRFAEKHLPAGKKVFFLYTYGLYRPSYTDAIGRIADAKGAQTLGAYGCLGFDTFGPLKYIGGIAKRHPNDRDITGALRFFAEIGRKAAL